MSYKNAMKVLWMTLPLITVAVLAVALLAPTAAQAIFDEGDDPPRDFPEPGTCEPNPSGDIVVTQPISVSGGTASVSFRNDSGDCYYGVQLASYEVYDLGANFIKTQQLFADVSTVIGPGKTKTLSVGVPSCAYQVDLFTGPYTPETNPDFANLSGFTVFSYKINATSGNLCTVAPPPPQDPTPPSCPLTSSDGTVVQFGSDKTDSIISSTSASENSITKSVSLSAGTYTVKTFGWDGYAGRENVSQAKEQWNVRALSSGSATLGTVGPTTDLADKVLSATRTDTFAGGLTIAQNGAKVSAVHAFPNDTSSPNSVVPICAAFKKVTEEPTPPSCPFTSEDGTIVVFSTPDHFTKIISSTDPAKNTIGPKSVSLTAGTYTVKTFSWDGSSIRSGQTQLHEQWNLLAYTSGDTFLDGIGPTTDLLDGVSSASQTDVFTDGLVLAQGAAKVKAIHAFPNDTSSPTSVVPICSAFEKKDVAANPTLTLIKHVVNDDGGTKKVSDFDLFIDDTQVASGVAQELEPGTYTASENNLPGYTAGSWGGDCASNGNVTLELGENKVCTITNNDNPVEPDKASLTLVKNVVNDNGGTAEVSDFELFVTNIFGTTTEMESGTPVLFNPGDYIAHEFNIAGYTAGSWGGDCAANGSVTLAEGDNKTCTITNNDNAPEENNDGGGRRRSRTPVVLDSSVPPPVIDVIKIPFPSALFAGGGAVNYSYTVTNPGTFALSNVVAADDKCAPINFISGDTDNDNKLDTNESWRYACQTYLTETTTNTITVEGTANGITARDFATANVVVDVPGFPETGYGSPMSSDDLLNIIMFSFCLLLPVFLYVLAKRKTA